MRIILSVTAALLMAACGGGGGPAAPMLWGAGEQAGAGYGPNPQLPAPQGGGGLPTIKLAEPVRWAEGETPVAPAGFAVSPYATEMNHPRWIYALPNGDVLVAESSTESERGGLMAMARNFVQRRAGALGVSPNRVILLRDGDRDGDVDERHVLLEGVKQPFGMTLIGAHLYVGATDAVLRYPYRLGQTRIDEAGERVMALPYRAEGNGHWTRDLLASPDGSKLYVSVGSVSNIGDNGMAVEEGRAAIHELDLATGRSRIFASGLRNPNGLAWEPVTGALWVNVNERDMLGDDLVPDYMTSVRDGGFYGWPYSYFGQNVDARVEPQNPELVARAIAPDYALGAHTASLGLAFAVNPAWPERYRGGAFIGQHGSWNRSEFAGYKVVFVPFAQGRPAGDAENFLTGFLTDDGKARGRPVGVAFDATGALLVADDLGNAIWRVAPAS